MIMTVYTCTKCRFCFERRGPVDACPDCASVNIRAATDEEIAQYNRNQTEFNDNDAQE